MKTKFKYFAGMILAGCVSLSTSFAATPAGAPADPVATPAKPEAAAHENFGVWKPVDNMEDVQIETLAGEKLGHIEDLGLDLVNGRIVEVLVAPVGIPGLEGKLVAVPPHALIPGPAGGIYQLTVSIDRFKAAPTIDPDKWADAGRSDRVAAAYRYFGQEPYFIENGDTASTTAARPKVKLGYVERSSKILTMPVGNFDHKQFGKVSSLTLDIPNGRILNVIVIAPGFLQTMSVIPAMALSFNETRDALLLDDTKLEYADEPRYVLANSHTEQESYQSSTTGALEQGTSNRDNDRTALILLNIRAAKISGLVVEVGTLYGRVTLRGTANTEADKTSAGQIAIEASRLELVDNQITVGSTVVTN